MSYQLLYTDKTFLNVDKYNTNIDTQIGVSFDYDQFPEIGHDFDYGNEKENNEELIRFKTGELVSIVIKITAHCEGETGYNYLGSNFVKSNDIENEVRRIIAEHDMKNNACIELKNNILLTAKNMTKYQKGLNESV
jgi:hypothetical protein